ncbi:MAG TPA: hypothetical protein VK504_31605, partial [Vicinamibacterales bacterium]|nr:hypothetical protein [Vicinamibacterales bacterium]
DAAHPYIMASHFVDQLRPAVNAMRALAGQSNYVFSNDLAPFTGIRRVHVTELRTALDQARAALGLSPLTYTDDAAHLILIKSQHVSELRGGVR